MSKQIKTKGIVLTRTDFGEADRIITFLTPDHGKVRIIAKAVRKSQSKLAGGIELFSVSEIYYVLGRGEVSTLTSSRLIKHYGNIVKDLSRTNIAYDLIKTLNKITEDNAESDYFYALEEAFKALDDPNINPELTKLWFDMQLLRLSGHTPNLRTDTDGQKLELKKSYDFDMEQMAFKSKQNLSGAFRSNQIKFLRLGFGSSATGLLQRVDGWEQLVRSVQGLVEELSQLYLPR